MRCSAAGQGRSRRASPRVAFTDPELAHVGLTRRRRHGRASGAIRVLRWPYPRERARPWPNGATDGHIKVITDRNGNILGATIVGAAGRRSIAVWTLAVSQKLNIRALAGVVGSVSDLCARWQNGRRMTYFTPQFDERLGASHHRVAASLWSMIDRRRAGHRR